jgi:hypothetical protein
MDTKRIANALSDQIQEMKRGSFEVLRAALEEAGGELEIQPANLARVLKEKAPRVAVDADDKSIVVRLVEAD